MISENTLTKIKSRYESYLNPAKVKGTYICPICGNGTGTDGDGITLYKNSNTDYVFKCFACGKVGDIIQFHMGKTKLSFTEAVEEMAQCTGVSLEYEDSYPVTPATPKEKKSEDKCVVPIRDFTKDYEKYSQALWGANSKGLDYLKSRGLSEDIIKQLNMGYDEKGQSVIIPVSANYYINRALDNDKVKYKNPTGASIEFYNVECLGAKTTELLFICEGMFDALSIVQSGYEAISIHSVANAEGLLKYAREKHIERTIITCMDNDEAGERATKTLIKGFSEMGVNVYKGNELYKGYNDVNEMFANDKDFKNKLERYCNTLKNPYNAYDFMRNKMQGQIDLFKKTSAIKTGLENFDNKLGGLNAGLYVIGALPSLGKTTLIHQIADHIAENGTPVLFFSLEQSILELITKSICRNASKLGLIQSLTAVDIRKGLTNPHVEEATRQYLETTAPNMNIIEGNFNCTVDFMRKTTEDFIKANKKNPLIVIDYLQIIPPSETNGKRMTDNKLITDYNVSSLKQISRDFNVPVIVISSFNRENYHKNVTYGSFKESGGIEYTADVLMGLQVACASDPKVTSATIEEERTKDITELELVILKNRNGTTSFKDKLHFVKKQDTLYEAEDFSLYAERLKQEREKNFLGIHGTQIGI